MQRNAGVFLIIFLAVFFTVTVFTGGTAVAAEPVTVDFISPCDGAGVAVKYNYPKYKSEIIYEDKELVVNKGDIIRLTVESEKTVERVEVYISYDAGRVNDEYIINMDYIDSVEYYYKYLYVLKEDWQQIKDAKFYAVTIPSKEEQEKFFARIEETTGDLYDASFILVIPKDKWISYLFLEGYLEPGGTYYMPAAENSLISPGYLSPGSTLESVEDYDITELQEFKPQGKVITIGGAQTASANSAVSAAAPPANAQTAQPTASAVLVNGEKVAFDAYNINDNNYFKLRDLAFVLNGTEKQFAVGWDAATNAISLTYGQPYTAVGGEMTGKGGGQNMATPTNSKILLDGKEASFTAYNIDGNNYFKLRDIGRALDFGVDWDGAINTIAIDTSKGYGEESGTSGNANSGSSADNYLKNSPAVAAFFAALGLEQEKISLLSDTEDIVVYQYDRRGLEIDIVEVRDVLIHALLEEGFENGPDMQLAEHLEETYLAAPSAKYSVTSVTFEKSGVQITHAVNAGGAEDIDVLIITKIK